MARDAPARPSPTGLPAWLRRWGVLLVGGTAGLALIVLARTPLLDPEPRIREDLARLNAALEAEVARAWEEETASLPLPGPALAHLPADALAAPPPPAPPRAVDWQLTDDEASRAADLLLREAERNERAGDLAQARTDLRDALARTDDPRRMALAQLRLIQLADPADPGPAVREAASWLTTQLDGRERIGPASVLVQAVIAAAPLRARGPAAPLDALEEHLAARLGQAALPDRAPGLRRDRDGAVTGLRVAPLRNALLDALEDAAATPVLREAVSELRRADLLAALHASFALPAPAGGATTVVEALPGTDAGEHELLVHDAASGAVRILAAPALAAAVTAWARDAARLPADFRLTLSAPHEADAEEWQRASTALSGTPLSLRVSPANRAAYLAGARAPYRWLRIALHALGAMCVLLAFALHRQRRREEELQRLKSDFVASVSHELRTPLSSILLMAENLRQGKAGAGTEQRYHGLILREAQRLRRLVDDVLDFTRLERGEGPRARLEAVELRSFADELIADLREWAEQQNATLTVDADWPATRAELDPEALRRAAFNLADNALRHSGSDRIDLRLGTAGDQLELTVRDHGSGLPDGAEERVFLPFQQLGTPTDRGRGAGLGLAIVAEIAAAHGGRARARNADDGGAIFTLDLPLRPAP